MNPTAVARRGRVRVVLALLATVLLTAGLSAPAQAERYIHHDPAHDVRKVNLMSTDDDGFVRAPHRKQGDYIKVKIWHQVKAVRVVGKFRKLDRVGQGIAQIVSIRTPDGEEHSFQVFAGPGMWKGMDSDDGQNCVIGHKVNYKRDRFSMRISRSCLGRPRWVKVGVGFIAINRRDLTADDSQLKKIRSNLTYSPRLQHA